MILPGYISGDIIKGAYSNADVFFFPSREETEGIVVLEALASRTNVLIRDIPVFDGWLENNQNCFKGNDVDDFVELIKKICNHQMPDLTDEGYKVAQSRSLKVIGEELKEVYEEVLEG